MANQHNQELLNVLQPGDLIEIPRMGYSHWAVYVGDGQVVHLVGEGGSCSISSASASGNARAQFKRDSFWDAVNSSVAQRNNFLDYSHRPHVPAVIVRNALSYAGSWTTYSLLFKNCEHFATWCRYGVGRSLQASTLLNVITAGVAGLIFFFFIRRS